MMFCNSIGEVQESRNHSLLHVRCWKYFDWMHVTWKNRLSRSYYEVYEKKSIMGHYTTVGGGDQAAPNLPGWRWWWDSMINGSNSGHKKWAPHSCSRQSPWLLLDEDWKTQEFPLFTMTGHIARLKCVDALLTPSEPAAISRQSPAISIIHFSIKFFWSRTNRRTRGRRDCPGPTASRGRAWKLAECE